tara:strand:- start:248 stop:1372 length:1125 start_codon:yes stop_codon:yes gene_type:complete
MQILHISNDFSLTKVHSNLYKALDKQNIDQIVFNPVRDATPVGNNTVSFESTKSAIIYSKKLKKYHRFLFRQKINFLYQDLHSKIDLNKIDICHATTLFSDGALAYKIKKKHGIPYICAVRATDIDVFLKYRPDLLFIALKILRSAEKIIFIGDSLKKRFFEHTLIKKYKLKLKSNSKVIYNGVDDFWLNNICPKKNIKPHRILYVGRFISRKSIPNLIEAILYLKNKDYNLELNLVGSGGTDEPIIKDFVRKNKGIINLLGQIKDKETLKQIYRENHIFAMPSKGETFGLVYIESLSQGLPVLYLRDEGIDGVFKYKIGEKCNVHSIKEITDSLVNLIDNYSKYDIDKIDFEQFRWRNIAARYLTIYKSICKH